MKIRTKKQNQDGIVRLETSGEIKEIIINEDIMSNKNNSINICFKGKNSSGIIEFTPREIEILKKEFEKKEQLLGDIKVMKFDK